jgi:hypothetical protein
MRATLPRKAWTMNVDAVEGSDEDSYVIGLYIMV